MRVVLTGGGTGGHIYPALALAEELRRHDPHVNLLYVGSRTGLEGRIVPAAGIPFVAIPARGLVGKSMMDRVRGVAALLQGMAAARKILTDARPWVVVGTGGYVSGPVGMMAAIMGIPLIVHEQNAFPSVTNRLLSPRAAAVAVPFPAVGDAFPRARRVVVTGNPVRPAILAADGREARRQLALDGFRRVVLVTSGSRGAQRINEAAHALAASLPEDTALLWVTGERYYDDVLARLQEAGLAPGPPGPLRIRPYLEEMELALAAADLAVTRAGGISLAEVTARGLPAVVVPSPHVTHDHQRHNARVLAGAGAAVMLEDDQCTGEALARIVGQLLADEERLAAMAAASGALGVPDAARRLAQLVLETARQPAPRRR
ncbi:MAG TPA: undecaprenyldiphospho-muramoylpentapeptide beta-N-acetylglucosaminyltransferase [Sphingobacteriaceae bacterium]|nr:undecaprenyldiphospho-muramoylpentapeptide beta-N-acetylglucosaminyltransferase [Sphingobacteriaceae bacterium]